MDVKGRLHPDILRVLDETGLCWEVKAGNRHIKLLIQGRLVGIHPLAGPKVSASGTQRAVYNTISQIRRVAAKIRGVETSAVSNN